MTRIDPRQTKRFERRVGLSDPIYQAWLEGQVACECPQGLPQRMRQNPYPKGRRHDEWDRGYNTADPLGDHHGRNV